MKYIIWFCCTVAVFLAFGYYPWRKGLGYAILDSTVLGFVFWIIKTFG